MKQADKNMILPVASVCGSQVDLINTEELGKIDLSASFFNCMASCYPS